MDYMVVIKRDSPNCKLHIGDVKIKQLQKFCYLGNVITDDRKCNTEIQGHIGIVKVTFQKVSKSKCIKIRNKDKSAIMFILQYSNESHTNS